MKKNKRSLVQYPSTGFVPNFFDIQKTQIDPDYLTISTVYRCVQLISSVVAETPLQHQEITENHFTNRMDSSLQKKLMNPNPFQTQFEMLSQITQDLMIHGNGYLWDDSASDKLWVIPADQIEMFTSEDYRNPFWYQITFYGKTFKLQSEDVIHIKNPLTTTESKGYKGISPIQKHRLLLDQTQGHDLYLNNFLENASGLSGILTTPSKLTPQVQEDLRKQFSKKFGGKSNAGKTPVLSNGLSYTQLKPLSPADTDYVKSKELSQQDVCAIFGVPESLLGLGDQKYSNAEQQQLVFSSYTISPILSAIQQQLTKVLIPSFKPREQVHFQSDPLKYTTSSEVSKTLSLLVNTGIMTQNEARKKYNLPEMAGADKLQEPKQETDTNSSKTKQLPKTPTTVEGESAYNNNRSADSKDNDTELTELRTEVQRLKSSNGRLKKNLGLAKNSPEKE